MNSHPDKKIQAPGEPDASAGALEETREKQGILLTRRSMLGILGIQVTVGTVAVSTGFAAPKNFNPKHYNRQITPEELPNARAWLVTDPTTCVGCRTCEIICSLSHDSECRPALSRIQTHYDPTKTLSMLCVMPDACRQCNMADCYLACEWDALVLDKETGARVIDPARCQGCGECFEACPWDMIVHNEDTDKYSKCDLCNGSPRCVEYCPANSIKFIQLR